MGKIADKTFRVQLAPTPVPIVTGAHVLFSIGTKLPTHPIAGVLVEDMLGVTILFTNTHHCESVCWRLTKRRIKNQWKLLTVDGVTFKPKVLKAEEIL